MKLIFSSNSSWSVFNFRSNLLSELSSKGFDIFIVAPEGEYLAKLRNLGYHTVPIEIDNSTKSIVANLRLLVSMYRIYRDISPDIVLHNAIKPNIYGAIICRILKIPAVNNISGFGSIFMSTGISSMIGKILYRFSQRKVQKVFFQNPTDLQHFLDYRIVKSEQCELLPGSGVDLNRFKPVPKMEGEANIKFCFVGRLIGDKGIYEYLDAAKRMLAQYPNVEFFILGELYPLNPTSVSQTVLNTWIESGVIQFLGKSDNVEHELHKFDCIVLPSYREGLSRVLLEASSMAIPAITSNVPGCVDVIEHGKNGFICQVKDPIDLYLQMSSFIALSKEERANMGAYGRRKVENYFDEKIVINRYLEAIDQLVTGKH